MAEIPTREELFEMAQRPIGGPDVMRAASRAAGMKKPPAEVSEAAKRAQKLWLPCGKKSVNNAEARMAEAEIKARNYDIEDAVEKAGGKRGHM